MRLVKKMLFYIDVEGVWKTIIRIFRWLWRKAIHAPAIGKELIYRKKYVEEIAKHIAGKNLYLLVYSFDWNASLYQRPHHLAEVLSQQKNAHVIFVSDQFCFDNFPGFITINPHLDVVPLRFLLKNSKMLQEAKCTTIFKSLPFQTELLKIIPHDIFVYDYIDDLSIIPFYTKEDGDTHHELMRQANLTVCTAKALYHDACLYTKKAFFSPNACDYNFFKSNRNCECNEAIAKQIKRYNCVLGYYGCLASWLDYELLLQVARRKPNWCFLLIGQCFDDSDRCLRESRLENILLWPAQPYKDLPHFIAAFGIQIIPFKVNQITRGTSPVKLFEYMATGKPILTSAMPECMQYRSVEIYHTAEEFIEKVEKLQATPLDAEYFKVMEQEAKENTWEARVGEILEQLKGCVIDG